MNERQLTLINTVMDMISGTAELMLKDPYYAPPSWIIENWWHTLNAVIMDDDPEIEIDFTSSNPVEEP